MKKTTIGLLLIGMFVLMCCQGCAGTVAAFRDPEGYHAIQKEAWTQKGEASKAASAANNQPLATMTAQSGEVFAVYNPNHSAPMPVVGEPNAMVQGADVILNSGIAKILGGGWAAGYMLGKVQGNNIASGSGTIDVTQDSGNTNTIDTGDRPDSSVVTTDSHDSTATPTVITQPEPVIVPATDPVIVPAADPVIVPAADPVIVRPEVVNPVIVGGDNE